jgi:predicted transglutaminase-like cysteine proteinase
MGRSQGLFGIINTYLQRNRVGEILVRHGKISPWQLKEALVIQKSQARPLGDVLLAAGLLTPAELRFALATQSCLRVGAAVVALLAGMTSLGGRQAHAGSIGDVPSSIVLASASSMAGGVHYAAPLFGTGEKVSTDLSSFTKWRDMFDRFQNDASRSSAVPVLAKWKSDLQSMRGGSLTSMANNVNNLMNKVRYIGDDRNWGRSDYWETPVEFMARGGDCEDFAIAKYASLRALGVPDSAMRVAIVKDMQKGIPHAILIVYTEDGPMVLDNQIKRMTPANQISHYRPIFSINRAAWWLHTDRPSYGSPTQIASAAR